MSKPVFPRPRRGRSPQIGPGTFVGRSSSNGTTGLDFRAVAWSPPPDVPSIELWCMHREFAPVSAQAPGSSHYLFLDKIPDEQSFAPPENAAPTSISTVNQLKVYSRDRLYDEHGISSDLTDWVVHVGVPSFAPIFAGNTKILGGVFSVSQIDRGPSPLAWVWVSAWGGREIWIYLRPNAEDGFNFVGTSPAGATSPYSSTTLKFRRLDPAGWFDWNADTAYFQALGYFKSAALNDLALPDANADDDFLVHDLRVQMYP